MSRRPGGAPEVNKISLAIAPHNSWGSKSSPIVYRSTHGFTVKNMRNSGGRRMNSNFEMKTVTLTDGHKGAVERAEQALCGTVFVQLFVQKQLRVVPLLYSLTAVMVLLFHQSNHHQGQITPAAAPWQPTVLLSVHSMRLYILGVSHEMSLNTYQRWS